MASITQTIPQYSLGMSEQPDHLKFPGQVTEVINAIPDITRGLFKRPGAKRISKLQNALATNSWFHYHRDEEEGSYIGQVAVTGEVKIWSCTTGAEMTVLYGPDPEWDEEVAYTSGQRVEANNKVYEAETAIASGGSAPNHSSGSTNNWLFIEATSVDKIPIQHYLQTLNPENLQFLTINDTTFVTNRDVSDYTLEEFNAGIIPSGKNATTNKSRDITRVGITGTTQARPHKNFGFIELLRTENGRQYGLNIKNTSVETPLARATRIKILRDDLDESDGSGHCPGIGTQVFSVTAASDYTGTTTNEVLTIPTTPTQTINFTFQPSAVDVVNDHIDFGSTAHNLVTGQKVRYTIADGATAIEGLPVDTDYYVVKIDNFHISLSDTFANATQTPTPQVVNLGNSGNTGGAGTGTQKLENLGVRATSGKNNLTFRLNILGQQGVSPNYSADSEGPDGQNYRCSYNREAVLLHGGEGWVTGDTVNVTLNSAAGGADTDADGEPDENASYTIRVEDHEEPKVQATIIATFDANGNLINHGDGIIRPAPTPFDADTAVTSDTILGSLREAIINIPNVDLKCDIVGTGLYVYSEEDNQGNSQPFTLEVVEDDLMRCFQSSVNDVQKLPNQCKHGYIVEVSNALRADEDDYYVKFNGEGGVNGNGVWEECALPGITKTLTNMPLVIQRTDLDTDTGIATFTVKQYTYAERLVGDTKTNPNPSFVGQPINKVLFFRNRLVFLSGENVITSRPGSFGEPDFFIETALTVSASDPIDIAASSMFPSELFDGIETTTGLVVFSTNQQFLLSSDDTVLNPDTAKLRSISTFNYNKNAPPISLGTTLAYIDNSGKFSRFNEMANIRREGEPTVVEVSKVVPTLLPKNIDLITNSRDNSIILLGTSFVNNTSTPESDTVYGFKYFQVAEKRQQAAWFKWKFNNPIVYHFIINDEYFFLDGDYFLQSIKLVQTENDPSITQDETEFLLHVDNHINISGGVYTEATDITTFANVPSINAISSPNHQLVVIDTDPSLTRVGRYAEATVVGNSVTVPGNWTGATLVLGFVYPYEVKLPRFYPTSKVGETTRADVNSSLVLHRLKIHFGKIGLYETTLKRVGKTDYTEIYESTELDAYDASDAPYLDEFIQTVPVYEKNENVDVILKSSHPAPATLRSVAWEGDYSPKYYKRV